MEKQCRKNECVEETFYGLYRSLHASFHKDGKTGWETVAKRVREIQVLIWTVIIVRYHDKHSVVKRLPLMQITSS